MSELHPAEATPASDPFARSEAIRAEFRDSPQDRRAGDHAVAQLKVECAALFENEEAMWCFLMEDVI